MNTLYIIGIILLILIVAIAIYLRKPKSGGLRTTQNPRINELDKVYPELPEKDDDIVTYGSPAPPSPPTRSSESSKEVVYPQKPPVIPAPSGAIPPLPPGIAYDEVALALSGPGCVQPDQSFNIKFIAYPESEEQKVENILKESDPDNKILLGLDHCNWQKGTEIKVRLYGDQLTVDEAVQTFTWLGKYKILNFDISLAEAAKPGNTVVKVDVLIADIVIAKLRYTLKVDTACEPTGMHVKAKPFKNAFASYSDKDRDRVIDRLSEIERNGVNVFWDKISLRAGQFWKDELDKAVKDSQVFMLFWSANAKASEWVEWEWKTALKYKGIDCIEPHPLEDPSGSPPPDELKALHFNDKYLFFRKKGN